MCHGNNCISAFGWNIIAVKALKFVNDNQEMRQLFPRIVVVVVNIGIRSKNL